MNSITKKRQNTEKDKERKRKWYLENKKFLNTISKKKFEKRFGLKI